MAAREGRLWSAVPSNDGIWWQLPRAAETASGVSPRAEDSRRGTRVEDAVGTRPGEGKTLTRRWCGRLEVISELRHGDGVPAKREPRTPRPPRPRPLRASRLAERRACSGEDALDASEACHRALRCPSPAGRTAFGSWGSSRGSPAEAQDEAADASARESLEQSVDTCPSSAKAHSRVARHPRPLHARRRTRSVAPRLICPSRCRDSSLRLRRASAPQACLACAAQHRKQLRCSTLRMLLCIVK